MANLDWIKRTVNTAGRPCPIRLSDKCPGERAGCAFWIAENVESGAQHDIVEGCLIAWQYVVANAQMVESIRTQATVQQAGDTIRRAFMTPFEALQRHPALRGSA